MYFHINPLWKSFLYHRNLFIKMFILESLKHDNKSGIYVPTAFYSY
uniref:Uncharacterized protein n=1 Tax=Arundo donax TaxID=35708 RepID=A0A0A8ZBP7_ARUDO